MLWFYKLFTSDSCKEREMEGFARRKLITLWTAHTYSTQGEGKRKLTVGHTPDFAENSVSYLEIT
jgi:hypothetical protein